MILPNFELICEIMLFAEGFSSARFLSKKFVTLYRICENILSKQNHYDWRLRAMKLVMVVAGKYKRVETDVDEEEILVRAITECNTPRLVTHDLPVFISIINDLFPNVEYSIKKDIRLIEAVKEAAIDLKLQSDDYFINKVS